MITRKQYLEDSENLHHKYYKQFVTPEIRDVILTSIGLNELHWLYEKDEHLNNIPLSRWDSMAAGFRREIDTKMRAVGDLWSLGGGTCVFKTAARMIVLREYKK
jgi:hypothetical protein